MTREDLLVEFGPDVVRNAEQEIGALQQQSEKVARAYEIFGRRAILPLLTPPSPDHI